MAWGIGLAALIFTVLVVNDSPTLLYAIRHGLNMEAGQRPPVEAEVYGLKLTHLLLPVSGHRLEVLRKIRQTYDRATFSYEGVTASLGMVGDLGFIFLLGWLFCSPQKWAHTELISAVAVLTLSAVLLGTIGGLGALFNFLISPQIRAYNRISVYIAFFSLFAVAFLLDALRRWMGGGNKATYLWYGLLGVVLCLGILDQTTPSFTPDYGSLKKRYEGEQDFVARLEASVAPGAMIFQLPNVTFPESQPIAAMQTYDELRGYLHSRSLRWSAGAMRGRPEALWPLRNGLDLRDEQGQPGPRRNRRIVLQLPPQALNTLAFAGFSGIYIDRQGFWDLGASLIAQLQSLLSEVPIESEDGRFAFFNLSAFVQAQRAKYSPEQWEAERRKTLELSSSGW
jgi:phosphoglycerol transferase